MRTEIIEILQKKYPEYCMQHIDTADEILRLFNVVEQSEQLPNDCGLMKNINGCDKGTGCRYPNCVG